MSQTKRDHAPAKFAKGWLPLWQAIEPVCQFTVEGLFRNVASLIKRIECVGEPVVENCQTRNSLAKEIL